MNIPEQIRQRTATIVCLASRYIIGLTFLLSSTGKVFGFEETSSQIIDFISYITPDVLLTPATVFFLFDIFIPYIFPWVEFILACFLIIGLIPRLTAVLCLPVILAFIGTNIWAIVAGGYTTCANCFGMWEQVFGSLTPVQALIYDSIILVLAIIIIIAYKGHFLASDKWLVKFWSS